MQERTPRVKPSQAEGAMPFTAALMPLHDCAGTLLESGSKLVFPMAPLLMLLSPQADAAASLCRTSFQPCLPRAAAAPPGESLLPNKNFGSQIREW